MDYKSKNTYKVHFKDGTSFESSGNSQSIKKSSIDEEFKWVSFHIQKEVKLKGKSIDDIDLVEYVLKYNDIKDEIK